MDKQLRESIKHDKFVEEVGHTVHYLQDHQTLVKKYGAVVAGVLVLAGLAYGFMSYQASQRQEELRKANAVLDGYVGDQNPTGGLAFKTQSEKDAATLKAFNGVASKYSGSKEGMIARLNAATLLCDLGKIQECEAALKEVSAGSDANTASMARLSLITLYQSQVKMADAEAMARDLIAKPTAVVSREQAQITLARIIAKTKPQEAKLLLESLQAMDRPPVTRAAVGVLGEMMGQAPQR